MIKCEPKKETQIVAAIIISHFLSGIRLKLHLKIFIITTDRGGWRCVCCPLYISIYCFKLIQANNADNYGLNVSIMQVLTNCFRARSSVQCPAPCVQCPVSWVQCTGIYQRNWRPPPAAK